MLVSYLTRWTLHSYTYNLVLEDAMKSVSPLATNFSTTTPFGAQLAEVAKLI
jgi:hypothetical protein